MVQASGERFRADVEHPKSLALVSLGCAKNAVDLQVRAGKMLKEGYQLSQDPDHADVAVVNTCAFIASAREEAESEIRRALELKRRGNYGKVVVTGCYPQRYPEARDAFPGVDAWEGVPTRWEEQPVEGFRLTGKAFAYLKIAEGCSHKCSYCAIPSIRGPFRSRPMENILAEARALLKTGCRELNIVAQDPMMWCEKRGAGGGYFQLPDLLWALDDFEGEYWVRVLYSYPSEITEKFLNWMNNARHAAKYIDVPLQHTVPRILKKMNRGGAIEATLSAEKRLRAAVPSATLRTTIMTGFPGETDRCFKQMLGDLERMRFNRLGAFAYSPEEGTAGAKMSGRPSRKVAEQREREVMKLGKRIWRENSRWMIGLEQPALVVAPGVARLESQAPDVDGVTYIVAGSAEPGEFVKVRITDVRGFDFIAEVVDSQ